jgi:hypothetical protein
MLSGNGGNDRKPLFGNNQKNATQNVISDTQLGQSYRFQLNSRSSFEARSTTQTSRPTNQPRQWNASFLNRRSSNVADYNSYDFSRPAANMILGSRGDSGKVAAQLKVDFGNDRPARGVQNDNFAMQAGKTERRAFL